MSKKYLWLWTVWIGVASGIYCYIYSLLPIASYNVIWMSFVALPIFFGAGAKIEEFPHYFCSLLSGVIWGVFYLFCIGKLVSGGLDPNISMFVVVSILTIICIGFHMNITGNTVIGKIPMIFGGLAMAFSQGGQNLIAIIGTLTGGLILGMAISEGGKIINKILEKNKTANI